VTSAVNPCNVLVEIEIHFHLERSLSCGSPPFSRFSS
jgi:hypothetical protein